MSLNQIVNVQITRETSTPTQKGFGTLLIVGDSDRFGAGERVRTYTDIEGVTTDFTAGDKEIDMATQAFGQEIRPEEIKIGQLEAADAGDYTVALAAIQLVDDDWYGLAIESITIADNSAVAAYIEARDKIFFAFTGDTGPLDNTPGNIAEVLDAAAYDRTSLLYSGDAGTTWGQAAWAGGNLPKTTGGITWAYQTLAGVPFDNLNPTQRQNLEDKNANHYTRVNGLNITRFGTMSSGEYIDVIRGSDFIKARMQERIYQELVNQDKIPYTNGGIAIIENLMREILELAVRNQILANFTTTVPDVLDISDLDKGNRCLPDMEFEGTLAGAIHKVKIVGRLVL